MTVLKSVLSPVLSSVLSSVLGDSAVTRFFTTLVSAGSMHYTFPAWTPSGDFSGSIDLFLSSSIDSFRDVALSGDNENTNTLVIDVNNTDIRFFAYVGGALQPILSITNPKDDKLHTLNFSYTGATASIVLNGGTPSTGTWALNGSQGFILAGVRAGMTGFYNGVPANLSLLDGSDDRGYAIDKDMSLTTTIIDSISGQDGTAVAISSSDFYILNSEGTIWLNQSGGSDLVIA